MLPSSFSGFDPTETSCLNVSFTPFFDAPGNAIRTEGQITLAKGSFLFWSDELQFVNPLIFGRLRLTQPARERRMRVAGESRKSDFGRCSGACSCKHRG
jgi:hypothetical protein